MEIFLNSIQQIAIGQYTKLQQPMSQLVKIMVQDGANRKKLLGGIIATSVFVFWILVDFYIFPFLGLSSYTLYEVLAYGSWIVIILICFGILSWSGWFPMRQNESSDSVE